MSSPGVTGCLAPPAGSGHDGRADLLAQVGHCATAGADSVECRLDLMPLSLRSAESARDLAGAARSAGIGLIATCRPERFGGAFTGTEAEQAALLAAWADEGADWIDVEAGTGLAARFVARPVSAPGKALEKCGLILSRHDAGMPRDLEAIAEAMSDEAKGSGAARLALKFVPTAGSLLDLPRLRDLLGGAGRRRYSGSPPLVAFAMGEAGSASRLLAHAWGSAGSYWAADPLRPIAPGQGGLDEALNLHRIREAGNGTWLGGLAGYPVARSLSPRLHAAAFRAEGRDALYLLLPCSDFAEGLQASGLLGVTGLSVTIPHKQAAARASVTADPFARQSGAVNTLLRESGGMWRGWNTDAPALVACLERCITPEPAGRRADAGPDGRAGGRTRSPLDGLSALVVGSGGAARAAAVALHASGVRVSVTARRFEAAAEVAALAAGSVVASPREAGRVDLLIKATPVSGQATHAGGTGVDPVDLPLESLQPRVVVEFAYAADFPGATPLLAAAVSRGCRTVSGIELLVEQALGQQLAWFGRGEGRERTLREAMSGTVDLQ